jgi:hypothetical protein
MGFTLAYLVVLLLGTDPLAAKKGESEPSMRRRTSVHPYLLFANNEIEKRNQRSRIQEDKR